MNILSHLKTFIKETDKILLSLCFMLSAAGILSVQSATASGIKEGQTLSRDCFVMILAVGAGIIAAIVISFIDYNFILKLWPLIAAASILLMVLTFLFGVGPEARSDAKTWLAIGNTGLYLQPSEIVKIGFIVTFTAHAEKVKNNINDIRTLLILAVHAVIPVAIVTLSGDMGSALVFIFIAIGILFAAGLKLRWFALGGGIVAVMIPLLWRFVMTDIQKSRIYALIDPDSYPAVIYQQSRGLNAILAGGITGSGYMKGYFTQRGLVPESENDMIFTVICEEWGMLGAILIMLLFVLLIVRVLKTGNRSGDYASMLISTGIASMLGSQVIINLGMVLRLLPVIGITLPFLSAGGSSNVSVYIAIGLVMSLHRYALERDVENFNLRRIRTPFS